MRIAPPLVLLLCAVRMLASDTALREIGRIPLPAVGGRIDHAAEDGHGQRLFLAALGNDTVEVIDLAAGRVLRSIGGVKEPQGLAYIPEADRLVIAEGGGDAVDILDGTTFARLHRIDHLEDADNVRVDPVTLLVYVGVGAGRSGALAVVDAKQARLVRSCPLPDHPEAFALEAHGPRIFVNVPDDRSIVVLDRTTGRTVARWTLRAASANFPMALDEASHRLFIGCRSPATLLVLDSSDGHEVAALPCVDDADDLFADPGAHRIYITGGGGGITVIDTAHAPHYAVLGTVATAAGARTSYLDAASARLYVACPHHLLGAKARILIFQTHGP